MSNTTTDPNTLTMLQGKTFRVEFLRTDSNNTPISLAGWGARFSLLTRPDGDVLLAVDDTTTDPQSPTNEACVQVEPGGATGTVTVRLGADQTANVIRNCVYDASIYLHADLTEVQPLASGPLALNKVGSG